MMILTPRKVIGFENSVNSGGIPYALLPRKHQKSPAKSMHLNHFKRPQFLICPKLTVFFRFDSYSNTKPLKAISIAAPQAAQSN